MQVLFMFRRLWRISLSHRDIFKKKTKKLLRTNRVVLRELLSSPWARSLVISLPIDREGLQLYVLRRFAQCSR